jgi:hypothetical protein
MSINIQINTYIYLYFTAIYKYYYVLEKWGLALANYTNQIARAVCFGKSQKIRIWLDLARSGFDLICMI